MIFCVLIIPTSLFSYYAMDRVSKYSEESIGVSKVDNLESLSKATEMVLNSFSRNVIQFANSASYRNLGEINSYQILNSDFEMVGSAVLSEQAVRYGKNGAVLLLYQRGQRLCNLHR